MNEEYEYRVGLQWTNSQGKTVVEYTPPLTREAFVRDLAEHSGLPA